MKGLVTILFSLALLLSQLGAFAIPSRQLCQSVEPCGCGDSSCCVKGSGTNPVPAVPIPTAPNQRTQLLAAFQEVVHFVLVSRESIASAFVPAVLPAQAAIPLYVRNCSYLI